MIWDCIDDTAVEEHVDQIKEKFGYWNFIEVGDMIQFHSKPHVTRDIWYFSLLHVDQHGHVMSTFEEKLEEHKVYTCLVIRKDPDGRWIDILFGESPVRFDAYVLNCMKVKILKNDTTAG